MLKGEPVYMKRSALAWMVALVLAGLWYWSAGSGGGAKSAARYRLPTAAQIEGIKSEKGLRTSATELKKLPTAAIVRVVDGDTVEIQGYGQKRKVRLLGINTPETVDPRRPVQTFGQEASDFTKSLLPPNTRVRYRYDVAHQDRYGRELLHLYLDDGTWVNALLIRAGYAQSMTIAPNVAAADFFRQLQTEARDEGIGLWQISEYHDAKQK